MTLRAGSTAALRPLRLAAAAAMTLFAANLYALALDPFLSPSPESWDAPGFVSMTNDSFGPGPVDEWDDLDSFGMRLGLPLGPVRLLSAISGLTDRTDSAADANRLDQASLGAAVSVLDSAPAQLLAGAGIDATGDLGGLLIQEGLHSGTGVDRPVPTSYSGELAAAPLGFFKLSISSASSLSPYLVMAGRASIPSRGSLLAVAGLRYSRPGALLAMSGGWRVVGGDAPATLLAVDAAENGPYLGFEMRVGLLALAFEDIPLRRKTNGSLGIALGSPRPPDGSRPISLDLGLIAGSSVAQRVRLGALLHGSRDGVHEEGFLAFAQGWFTSDHPDATATMFAEYSAGGSIGRLSPSQPIKGHHQRPRRHGLAIGQVDIQLLLGIRTVSDVRWRLWEPKEAGTLAATNSNFEQAAVVSPSRLVDAERRDIFIPARGTHR